MNLGRVDYESLVPPRDYRCTSCGAHGCKLWRDSHMFADHVRMLCCDCAGKDEECDVTSIDADGRLRLDPKIYGKDRRCDQIGSRLPAVPTEDGETFWGYTSVPDAGVRWWRALPTRVATR
jgi:hypothetical protein